MTAREITSGAEQRKHAKIPLKMLCGEPAKQDHQSLPSRGAQGLLGHRGAHLLLAPDMLCGEQVSTLCVHKSLQVRS